MIELTIRINVKNHNKLVERYSAELKSENTEKDKLNQIIESKIKREVEKALDRNIKNEFHKNNIEARIEIK